MTLAGKQVKPIDFNMRMELDRAAERAYMFEHVFKQEERKFYNANYHGVDLAASSTTPITTVSTSPGSRRTMSPS